MDNKEQLKLNIQSALKKLGVDLELSAIVIDNSKSIEHGDFASNVALKYARSAGKTPLEFANALINELDMNLIEKVEIAGPGFINFFMKNDSLQPIVKKILSPVLSKRLLVKMITMVMEKTRILRSMLNSFPLIQLAIYMLVMLVERLLEILSPVSLLLMAMTSLENIILTTPEIRLTI